MDHLFKGSSSRRADAVKSLDWSHDIATDPEMFAFHDARDLTLPGEVVSPRSSRLGSSAHRQARLLWPMIRSSP